ncbi:hypothetical protein Ae406Ps2_6397c [Pseudonocardia sp. Ae406_Ps2]|nr:hypothetical protein Ae406Ps2_6397c [Pseudonocardia sp. Ae406_Ps2]
MLTCGFVVVVGVHGFLQMVADGAGLGWCRHARPSMSGSCGWVTNCPVGW